MGFHQKILFEFCLQFIELEIKEKYISIKKKLQFIYNFNKYSQKKSKIISNYFNEKYYLKWNAIQCQHWLQFIIEFIIEYNIYYKIIETKIIIKRQIT